MLNHKSQGKCKYCGYPTNPERQGGGKMYKYTPKFCSITCQQHWELLQDPRPTKELLKGSHA